ncbi:hypothetical protein, partial [Fangia hongkongensis]
MLNSKTMMKPLVLSMMLACSAQSLYASNYYSNAYNTRSSEQSYVDEKTGAYQFQLPVGYMTTNKGLRDGFQLNLIYVQNSSADMFGLGAGWQLNITHYDETTNMLYLSSGAAYFLNSDDTLQYYKLKDLKVERDENRNIILVYASG